MLRNARPLAGGDEYIDFKNPIGHTFLSGSHISAEAGKSRLSVPARRSAAFRHAGVKPHSVEGNFTIFS